MLEEFLNACSHVSAYDNCFDKSIYTVIAQDGFMREFKNWNERNGITWSYIRIPNSTTFVLYQGLNCDYRIL